MHLLQLEPSNEGIELLQVHRIVLDALLVAVVLQVLRCRHPERARIPQTVELRLAQLGQPLGEVDQKKKLASREASM
jgi:hypothetical protein